LDGANILFALRSFIGHRVEALMPRIIEQFNEFADYLERSGTGFKDAVFEKDLQGPHSKSYDGYDRNSKTVDFPISFVRHQP
jgi:hypothetical protein